MKVNTNGFKLARMMFAAIAGAMKLPTHGEQQLALGQIGPYISRGKGRGAPSRRFGNPPGKYVPHQGERETARRRRQIEAGILTASNGLAGSGHVPM